MTKTIFLEKYPVNTIEIKKSDTKLTTVEAILEQLKNNIEQHPIAKYIAIFDNYEHTSSLDGDIMNGMKAAQVIMFCFGSAIPNNKILGIRPRSIGVSEFEDKFVFDFMDAPKDEMTNIMAKWCHSIAK